MSKFKFLIVLCAAALAVACTDQPPAREEAQNMSEPTDDAWEAEFAEIALRDGVQSTDSGLMYEVLQSAEGPSPNVTDTVTTHYHGTFIDGSVFDSSVERGQPASFPLDRVITGWTEALSMMSVGEKWRLYLPPELAYGARGAPPRIKPNTPLIFEVELLGIEG